MRNSKQSKPNNDDQMALFEATKVELDQSIEDIPVSVFTIKQLQTRDPDAAFVESIKRFGNIQPIVVMLKGSKYIIFDGIKRVAATKLAGRETVRAMVVKSDVVSGSVLGLMLNAQRSANTLREMQFVVDLAQGQGYSAGQVCHATGIGMSTLKRYLRLADLPSVLIDGGLKGKISVGVLTMIANWPDGTWADAMTYYKDHGSLTMAEAKALRTVVVNQAVAGMPQSMFTGMPDPIHPPANGPATSAPRSTSQPTELPDLARRVLAYLRQTDPMFLATDLGKNFAESVDIA